MVQQGTQRAGSARGLLKPRQFFFGALEQSVALGFKLPLGAAVRLVLFPCTGFVMRQPRLVRPKLRRLVCSPLSAIDCLDGRRQRRCQVLNDLGDIFHVQQQPEIELVIHPRPLLVGSSTPVNEYRPIRVVEAIP